MVVETGVVVGVVAQRQVIITTTPTIPISTRREGLMETIIKCLVMLITIIIIIMNEEEGMIKRMKEAAKD
jgi:hypothetical protein